MPTLYFFYLASGPVKQKKKKLIIGRLVEMFLNFLNIPQEKGTIQERCKIFNNSLGR
jgi:hypothetical protein